ncbi:hypothetical protein OF83DRAFT_1057232 [Amylostereum chailletii]|nr:hypothetical protein OF83DRAFT_1057232 [Amylostereum chailletii]
MSLFLRLPHDVLLTIRDSLSLCPAALQDPVAGLVSHIALSTTCRRLQALYAFEAPSTEDAFWKSACVIAGFGRPLRRDHHRPAPSATDLAQGNVLGWKAIARLAVAHHRLCEIRSCKDANIWFGQFLFRLHPQRRASSPKLDFHPLFYYLHFSPSSLSLDPTSILFTQLPTHPDCRYKLYAPLSAHASASCTFATSPPVRTISFVRHDAEDDDVVASVHNPDGCTILDVNRLFADMQVLPRSESEMRTVVTHYQSLSQDYQSTSLPSFAETMNAPRHRGFLGDHRSVPPHAFPAALRF